MSIKTETITLKAGQGYEDTLTGFRYRNRYKYPINLTFSGSTVISVDRVPDAEIPQSEAPSFVEDFERDLKQLMADYRVTRVITSKGGSLKKLTFADADGDKVSVKL